MKDQSQDSSVKDQELLRRQKDILAFRMKKLSSKQSDFNGKAAAQKEKIRKKYEDMKRVLDQDLEITLCQLDMEAEAVERVFEESVEKCFLLTQEIDQHLTDLAAQMEKDRQWEQEKMSEMEGRIMETLKKTDPEKIQTDEFKSEQLFSLTINLLLFIRSQVPITKKLFQSYAQEVVLDHESAHPKLMVSSEGDSVTYTDAWQDVSENAARFDTTLNVISRRGFSDVRNYWEVQVSGKTYWELGLTYPEISRKGREEDCWLGRGPTSWCVEYFNGTYTAWHNGVSHELTHVTGRSFQRIGIFSSSEGGLVCFLGADTMTPLYSFCAGTFRDRLYQVVCPGHDNEGTNLKPLVICDASRSAPTL